MVGFKNRSESAQRERERREKTEPRRLSALCMFCPSSAILAFWGTNLKLVHFYQYDAVLLGSQVYSKYPKYPLSENQSKNDVLFCFCFVSLLGLVAEMSMATVPSHGLRHVSTTRPWLTKTLRFSSAPLASLASEQAESDTTKQSNGNVNKSSSYFPKRGQTVELVCESLAFKGKGLCKVADTGFVVMCDRALPGERFIGRVTRRKGSYAEVRNFFGLLFGCLENL